VTGGGVTRVLLDPFFVVTNQNPHQFRETYPLPEDQLDRFMVAPPLGYPERRSELRIARAEVERRLGPPASR
jgi:MoxR-like ATPase